MRRLDSYDISITIWTPDRSAREWRKTIRSNNPRMAVSKAMKLCDLMDDEQIYAIHVGPPLSG